MQLLLYGLYGLMQLCNCLKKENSPMGGASLTEYFLYYVKISCDDEKYKYKLHKGICETTFTQIVTQIIKNLLMLKKTRTIQNCLLNTGSQQIRNFTHRHPGV